LAKLMETAISPGELMRSDRYNIVIRWLESKYRNKSEIPSFELNESTLAILYQLAITNERRNRAQRIIIENNFEIMEQYRSEATRLHALLERMGFSEMASPVNLSDSSTSKRSHDVVISCSLLETVAYLAKVAVELDVKDPSLSSLLLALDNSSARLRNVLEERQRECTESKQLSEKIQEQMEILESWQNILSTLNQQREQHLKEMEMRTQNISYLEAKAIEYEEILKTLKEEVQNSGVTPNVYHRSLVQLSDELRNLKRSIEPKLSLLQSYNELPPDISLAKIQIEDAKRKLYQLEEQLTNSVNELTLS